MSSVSAVTAAGSAQSIRTDYLTLLITQMRNQNQLEPLNNTEMAAQLAMFSQLEQLENQSTQLSTMNGSFDSVLSLVQRTQAAALIGKQVSFLAQTPEGQDPQVTSGTVKAVTIVNGQPVLNVGDYAVGLDAIIGVTQ